MPKTPANTAQYPSTLYAPPEFPNLGDMDQRRRLSPAAFRAFVNIMEKWSIRDEDARQLLGGVSNGAFYTWKATGAKVLEQDKLLRISLVLGIFKSLNILFSPHLADQWVRLPNSNAIFGGRSPLAYMLSGGTPAMTILRQLLDARRGG